MKKNFFWHSGFTLIEVLVVIAIMGILATAGTVSFIASRRKAEDSKMRQDVKAVQSALEQNFDYATSVYDFVDYVQELQGNVLPPNVAVYTASPDSYTVCSADLNDIEAGNCACTDYPTCSACTGPGVGGTTHFCAWNLQ